MAIFALAESVIQRLNFESNEATGQLVSENVLARSQESRTMSTRARKRGRERKQGQRARLPRREEESLVKERGKGEKKTRVERKTEGKKVLRGSA